MDWVVSLFGHWGQCGHWIMQLWIFTCFLNPWFQSFGFTLGSVIVGSYGNSMFNFWGTAKLFSTVAASFYIPTSKRGGYNFSTFSPTFNFHSLIVAIPLGVRWYLIWFICICQIADFFSKTPHLVLLVIYIIFSVFYFIYLHSNPYYLYTYISFEFSLLFF